MAKDSRILFAFLAHLTQACKKKALALANVYNATIGLNIHINQRRG
jgi:hypothetical protein